MEPLAAQSVSPSLEPAGRGPVERAPARVFAFIAGLLLLALLSTPAYADKGKKWFEEGRKAEARGDLDAALAGYQKAAEASPENAQYRTNLYRVRFRDAMEHVNKGQRLRSEGKLDEAMKQFEEAYRLDPSNMMAGEELRRTMAMIEARKSGAMPGQAPLTPREQAAVEAQQRLAEIEGPIALTPPSRAGVTLHASNDAKVLFETIGKLAGINVLFDPDFRPAPGTKVTLDLNNVTLEQALDSLGVLTHTLWKPLTTNTILVYQDSRKAQLDPMVVKTFYLTNTVNPTEITELAQVLRNLLEITRLQTVNSQNAIVIRDTPDKIAIAEKIINDIDKAKPEVVIDVAVLAVSRDYSREIGLFPGSPGLSIPVAFAPGGQVASSSTSASGTTTTTTTNIPISRLNRLSTNDWAITLPGATLNLMLSDSRTKLLQNPEVRASDGQVAKLRIGERIPIATGSFQPGIGGVGINPLVNTQFQYTDVGVILEVTPHVHAEREVSIKLVVEISAVNNFVNIGGISQPVIGQRRVEEEIRLREGEMNVLGGIIENQLQNTLSGIPGLSQVPGLKYLFSDTKKTLSDSEVLIVLTPHIVRVPNISALNLRAIDVGSQSNIQVKTRQEVTAPPLPRGAPVVPPTGPGAGGALVPGAAAPGAPAGGVPLPQGVTPPVVQPAPGTAPPAATTQPAGPSAAQPTPATPEEEQSTRRQVTALRLDSGVYNQSVGDRFNVQLVVDAAKEVQSVPLQLKYDPKEIKLVDVINGDFLGRDGQAVAIVQRADEQTGTATVVLNRPPGSAGISGSGVLAILSFQAIGRGDAVLTVPRAEAKDPGGQPVQIRGTQARVIVK